MIQLSERPWSLKIADLGIGVLSVHLGLQLLSKYTTALNLSQDSLDLNVVRVHLLLEKRNVNGRGIEEAAVVEVLDWTSVLRLLACLSLREMESRDAYAGLGEIPHQVQVVDASLTAGVFLLQLTKSGVDHVDGCDLDVSGNARRVVVPHAWE